jgi:hypothetical protein
MCAQDPYPLQMSDAVNYQFSCDFGRFLPKRRRFTFAAGEREAGDQH